jgi:tetratricopeptide (TPR) repeat protein
MDLFGEKADVAQAVFWIGQSQIELGQVQEAISAYLNAIERFGNEVEQEGVDKIVLELVTIAKDLLSDDDRAGLVTKLNLKLTALGEGQDVLRLRIRVAVAMLKGDEASIALGAELLAAQQDLALTTPISLALMCDAAVAAADSAQMLRLYEYFIGQFEDSDLLWHPYRAKTYALLAAEDYPGVLKTIEDAQSFFGADDFMGWAQLIKANTLFKTKKFEEAEKEYNMVMGVGAWRGPLFAEAMFGMGNCRLALGDYETAHSFYQRTYLLFKGYDNGKWAADGYLAAADCLLKLGREADAVKTWSAMLEDSYVNTLPQAKTAQEMIKKYGGAL